MQSVYLSTRKNLKNSRGNVSVEGVLKKGKISTLIITIKMARPEGYSVIFAILKSLARLSGSTKTRTHFYSKLKRI